MIKNICPLVSSGFFFFLHSCSSPYHTFMQMGMLLLMNSWCIQVLAKKNGSNYTILTIVIYPSTGLMMIRILLMIVAAVARKVWQLWCKDKMRHIHILRQARCLIMMVTLSFCLIAMVQLSTSIPIPAIRELISHLADSQMAQERFKS